MATYVEAEYKGIIFKMPIAEWGRIFRIPKSTFSSRHRAAIKEGKSSEYFITTIIRRRIFGKLTK